MHGTGGNRGPGDLPRSSARETTEEQVAERPRGRASQRIVDQLRQSIRAGELTPGDRLPAERDLCERYGVSRVTIREALRSLEASGLVNIRLGSHGGAFVTSPTAESVAVTLRDYFALSAIAPQEIHELRGLLELAIVPLACERASDSDIEQLAGAYRELEDAWHEGQDTPHSVRAFHAQLARAAGNTAAEVILSPLYGSATHAAPETRQGGVEDHRQLLEALRERDSDRATTIMRALLTAAAP